LQRNVHNPDGTELKKFPLASISLRLHVFACKCGTCPIPFPPEATCPGRFSTVMRFFPSLGHAHALMQPTRCPKPVQIQKPPRRVLSRTSLLRRHADAFIIEEPGPLGPDWNRYMMPLTHPQLVLHVADSP
jgi:hypothetical protein